MTAPGNNCKGEGKLPGDAVKGVEPPLWHKKNEEIVEQEFQKDLEVGIQLNWNIYTTSNFGCSNEVNH